MTRAKKLKSKKPVIRTWFSWVKVKRTICYNCEGTGVIKDEHECPTCDGKDYIEERVEPTYEEVKELMFNDVLNKCNEDENV
jgi:DnaJ-class molecular chaperone